jgi:hypothetical protein
MFGHEHVQRDNGGWLFPPSARGVWAVRRVANGTLQVIWLCADCEYRSSSIPHYVVMELGVKIRELPIVEDYAGLYGRCVVRGCESDEVELNHFAPQAIFGQEADDWPTGYLCIKHHREWGERVTPQLNSPRSVA